MRIMGFGANDSTEAETAIINTSQETAASPSLVSVRFENCNRALTYYNDRFTLKEGDRVFVDGKFEGAVGIVESVTTRFRIKLSDYQRVISLAQTPISGTYTPVMDKMQSYDTEALSPDAFRQWILPPASETKSDEPSYTVTVGDGWVIPLDDPTAAEGAEQAVFERAVDYCNSGKVAYISVRNSIGKAYIEGKRWYEIDFRLENSSLTEGYCECPYFGLCKHLLAVGVTLAAMLRRNAIDLNRDFVLIDSNRFYRMVQHTKQSIHL